MSMKPLMGDHAKPIPGTVNNPTPKDENTAIPGTVTTKKHEECHPIPGTVSQGYSK